MEAMFALAATPPTIADAPSARPLAPAAPAAAPGTPAAAAAAGGVRVELEDVHFGYGPGREVLRGVSLVAEPGTTLALVGPRCVCVCARLFLSFVCSFV